MSGLAQAARALASLGLKAQVQKADVMLMQARRMGECSFHGIKLATTSCL